MSRRPLPSLALVPVLLLLGPPPTSLHAATGDRAGAAAAADQAELVARVNGVPIPAARLEAEVATRVDADSGDAERQAVRQELLDRLIATELLYQQAARAKELPEEAEVAKELERLRAGFGEEGAFVRAMHEEGLSAARLKDEIRRELAVRRWIEKNVERRVKVAEDDLVAYYRDHPDEFVRPEGARTRHILIRVADGASKEEREEAREKAEVAQARVRTGEDFAAVAREVSEDRESAGRGGDLGLLLHGYTVEELEKAAFALAVGESKVVETPFGFHVIQVTGREPKATMSFAEVQERLREFVLIRARRAELQRVIGELRKKAEVEVY